MCGLPWTLLAAIFVAVPSVGPSCSVYDETLLTYTGGSRNEDGGSESNEGGNPPNGGTRPVGGRSSGGEPGGGEAGEESGGSGQGGESQGGRAGASAGGRAGGGNGGSGLGGASRGGQGNGGDSLPTGGMGAGGVPGGGGVAVGGAPLGGAPQAGAPASGGEVSEGGAAPAEGGAPTEGGAVNQGGDGGVVSDGGSSAGAPTAGQAGSAGEGPPSYVIDPIEDSNVKINTKVVGIRGSWYRFPVATTTISMPLFDEVEETAPDGITSTRAARGVSEAIADASTGMGFDLNAADGAAADEKGFFDLTPYPGIRFWYRAVGLDADYPVSCVILIAGTVPENASGTCTEDCYDHYNVVLPDMDGDWHSIDLFFPGGTGTPVFAQEGWSGIEVPWDPTTAIGVQFVVKQDTPAFEIWIDQVELIPPA